MSIRLIKVRDILEHLTNFGLLSAVVLPPVYLPGYHLYLVTLMSPIILILFLALSRGYIYISSGLVAIGVICISVLISTLYSYMELGVPRNSSDLVEGIKFLQFIPYMLATQYFDDTKYERKCHNYLSIATMIFIMVGLIQAFNIAPFVSVFGAMYGSDNQLATHSIGSRILITGSDPNVSGAIALLFAAYNIFMYMDTKKFKYILFSVIIFYLLLMTQSRTVLIGCAFATLAFGLLFSQSRLITRLSAVFLVALALFISVYYLNLEYIIVGFQTAEAGHNKSVNVRLANIQEAFKLFQQSMLLGWGPAKSIHPTVIDSEYALILERYGVVGIMAFAFYLIHQFRLSIRTMKLTNKSWIFGRLSAFYVLFSVIFMATNNVFSGYQLMAILILLLSLVTIKRRSNTHELYTNKMSTLLSV